jgi:hypothetical protein
MSATGEREAISVKVGGKIDPPPTGTRREGADEVTIDSLGQRMATISMDLRHQMHGIDSLEFYANGVGATQRICAFDEGFDPKLTCTSKYLPPPK